MKLNSNKLSLIFIFAFIAVFLAHQFLFFFPYKNSENNLIRISDGSTLTQISSEFKERGMIKSSTIFIILTKMMGAESDIKSGDYLFKDPIPLFFVINRLVNADFGFTPLKITIPEGYAVKDIAGVFANFDNFDKEKFLKLTVGKEGYLFPDTYFFTSKETAEEVIEKMENNFKVKAGEVPKDILIMASIIEKEAHNKEDRKIISGILWKRLNDGMLLQVDAVFDYLLDKESSEITQADLKMDSPYNTYKHKGLPPTPICNPGLDAIEAAKNPVDSKYWYYLSDKKGVTHFAKTFEEHKRNRAKYGI
jgi:UPF0755 protein